MTKKKVKTIEDLARKHAKEIIKYYGGRIEFGGDDEQNFDIYYAPLLTSLLYKEK